MPRRVTSRHVGIPPSNVEAGGGHCPHARNSRCSSGRSVRPNVCSRRGVLLGHHRLASSLQLSIDEFGVDQPFAGAWSRPYCTSSSTPRDLPAHGAPKLSAHEARVLGSIATSRPPGRPALRAVATPALAPRRARVPRALPHSTAARQSCPGSAARPRTFRSGLTQQRARLQAAAGLFVGFAML
jgi:hypothetical protein